MLEASGHTKSSRQQQQQQQKCHCSAFRRTAGVHEPKQQLLCNGDLPALRNEGPDDGVVLGDVVGVVSARVLLRRRRHATPPRRRRRRTAQLSCTARQILRLFSRNWCQDNTRDLCRRGEERETLEQEGVLEEAHGDGGED